MPFVVDLDPIHGATGKRRIQILQMIWDGERSVGDIASELPVSIAAVSQHLAKLRKAGLVSVRAEGRKRFYSANRARIGAFERPLAPTPALSGGGSVAYPPPPPPETPRPAPIAPPEASPPPSRPSPRPDSKLVIQHPERDDLDEMAGWYRQGLRARVIALEESRAVFDTDPDSGFAAMRRIAQSLTRPSIEERFREIGATAREAAARPLEEVGEHVGRLIGAIRQASVHADSATAKILIVEDNEVEATLYASIIGGPNREVIRAGSAEDAQSILESEDIDLIILDLGLPGADGRELLIGLGRRPRTAFIPVILLTGRTDVQTRTEAMSLGADAYYTKPVETPVLSAAVSMTLERSAEARQLGRHDPLTGLRNRSVFLDDVRHLAATAIRAKVDLSLAIIDIDGLGAINDRHGTEAGDVVVRTVATRLRQCFRASDLVARWGGGKFAVLFANTLPEGAAIALGKFRDVTETLSVTLPDDAEHVITWQGGIASIRDPVGVDDAAARATRRLQLASRAGQQIMWVDAVASEGVHTVLIVEDDDILGDLMEHRLSREGFAIERFSDGAEALSALGRINASAVVLDTMLPGAEGFEVLRRLKEAPSFAGVPVIVLTFGGERDAARALNLGANDSLAKPFAVEELVARVSRLIADFEDVLP